MSLISEILDSPSFPTFDRFAVAAESYADVAAGVAFAAKHNLRVAVKGTGHDWFGRSGFVFRPLPFTLRLQPLIWCKSVDV